MAGVLYFLLMCKTTSKRTTPRVACALIFATLFIAGQALHVAAAVHGPCHMNAATFKHAHTHSGGTGQHSADQGGSCCDRPAPCDCDFNQAGNDEGSALPVTAAGNLTSPASLDPGVVDSHVAVAVHSPEKASSLSWTQARAPSEALFSDTTKLIC